MTSEYIFASAFIGEERTFAWFIDDRDGSEQAIYRVGDDGVFRVSASDVRRQLEPLIFLHVTFPEEDVYDDPAAGWSIR